MDGPAEMRKSVIADLAIECTDLPIALFKSRRILRMIGPRTSRRMTATRRCFPSLISAVLVAPVADGQFALTAGASTTRAELVSEMRVIAAGSPFEVALSLTHPAGWHSYYRNSGGIEQAPQIAWTLPPGFSVGEMRWPVPEVKDGLLGKSFIHSGSPAFLIEIIPSPELQSGETVTLTATAEWQICKESCINESKEFTLVLTAGEQAEADPAVARWFEKARVRLPQDRSSWTYDASSDGDDIVLRVGSVSPPAPAGFTDFVPDVPFVRAASDGGSINRSDDGWIIRLKRAQSDVLGNAIPQGDAISGVLLGEPAVSMPLTAIARQSSDANSDDNAISSTMTFPAILLGMFIGGLLLNLMPCVFPVIGLKIMGFVQQAGSDRRKIALHGLIFAIGVLLSFAVLSGLLFAARGAMGAVGWGYQLQQPWVVLTLLLVMFVFALNLAGVFEIGSSATSVGGSLQSRHGFAGSFFSGVLATEVATPCSAPFLGAAIGAAVALPALPFFSAFAAMAVGLALPYLLLSFFPSLIERLPRPGPWMVSFKQSMAFLLFATAGFLLWVYAGITGLEHLLGTVFGLCAVAVAAWIHGRWNLPHRRRSTRITAATLAVAFAALGIQLARPPAPSAIDWQPWSQARVDELLAEGRPVYIDFTARWCATCQFNKKRAYTPEVVARMNQKRVVTLVADKTRPNPEIDRALRELGRSAIPVNVLLVPGRAPHLLPELLSPDDLMRALEGW
jgi:thiol:disulfide interchange protein DsbD